MYDLILKDFKFNDSDILSVFPYGSRVYGNNNDNSDWDFVIVLKNELFENYYNSSKTITNGTFPSKTVTSLLIDSDRLDSKFNPISLTIYSEASFIEKINEHKIFALECIFCPSSLVLKNNLKFNFKLNKSKLRHSISEKCSKDFNQAKKRFSDSQEINPVTGERYIKKIYEGKKSLFHCFRMIDFAIQIIEKNKIENFSSCNELWEEIYTDPSEDWNYYHEKYHLLFNKRMTEFRQMAPK